MTWIKICGITNIEDARSALAAGADALGFVFWEHSRRRVDAETAAEIAAALPAEIEKVGVLAGEAVARWREIAARTGLTAFQFHLNSSASDYARQWKALDTDREPFGKRYLAVPAALLGQQPGAVGVELWALGEGHPPACHAFFLDSGNAQQPGGSGKTFDWEKAAAWVQSAHSKARVVVAGGLRPSNVAEAIRILKPWGVDVSSGVETEPGRKDPEKIRAFVAAVRQVESEV